MQLPPSESVAGRVGRRTRVDRTDRLRLLLSPSIVTNNETVACEDEWEVMREEMDEGHPSTTAAHSQGSAMKDVGKRASCCRCGPCCPAEYWVDRHLYGTVLTTITWSTFVVPMMQCVCAARVLLGGNQLLNDHRYGTWPFRSSCLLTSTLPGTPSHTPTPPHSRDEQQQAKAKQAKAKQAEARVRECCRPREQA